jgi:hypothetical protein
LIELRRRLLWCVAAIVMAFFNYLCSPGQFLKVQPLPAGQGKLIYTDIFKRSSSR